MLNRFAHWTDMRRTPADDARLGACLAFVAGAANAGGFLAVGQYTSHMTGIVSGIADYLALSHGFLAATGVAAVLAFVLGAMTTAILVNWAGRKRLHARYSIPLLVEATLLLLFGLVGARLAAHTVLLPLTVLLLCFLMGLQNAVITKISHARIRTTHVTGLVTDIGIELGKLVYVNRGAGARVTADRGKLALQILLLTAFLTGGVMGALGFQRLGYAATMPLALLLLVLALPPLVSDMRTRWRLHGARRRGHAARRTRYYE